MKRPKALLLTLSLLILIFSKSLSQDDNCTLKGKVIDRDSKEILLYKATEDIRRIGAVIPIKDGSFEYNFTYKSPEAYQLVFKDEYERGMWRPIIFFPEDGVIDFTLYPTENYDKNLIIGSSLNKEYSKFQQSLSFTFSSRIEKIQGELNILRQNGEYYSDTANSILNQIKVVGQEEKSVLFDKLQELQKDHSDKSPKAKLLGIKMDSLMQEYFDYRSNFVKNNPSIVAFYLLYEDARGLEQFGLDIIDIRKNYILLSEQYPDHLYTHTIGQMIESYEAVKIGGDFIDFEAPDIEGNLIKISDKIQGNIALLDLWASWCGPCIRISRSMVPVYKEYKDKGFTIVGIAREFGNITKFEKALEREQFPWLNLIELDDQNEIWLKYNIPFSGGGTFLIDKKGKILAIDPSAEEVRKILEEHL